MQSRRNIPYAIKCLAILVVLLAASIGALPQEVEAAGREYYVDSVGGSDANAGTSEGAAWKSLAKVNGSAFQAG
ncbi:MAG: hypothetical protein ACYC4R_07870, partial [Anaerolineae bacterium]